MVLTSGRDLRSAEAAVDFLLERRVEGIIYAAMFHRVVSLPNNINHVPTALANCYVADQSLPSAVPDEVMGGYRATRRLLEAGHRRIAFINATPPAIDAAEGRLAGYQMALEEFDLAYDPALVMAMSDYSAENFAITEDLLSRNAAPTAIFCGTDRTAMSCYAAIMAQGLRIPEDVAVVGFDNQADIADGLLPALTTIQLPHYEMGRWAYEQLFAANDNSHPTQFKIDCQLIERDSV
jgi:LacI family transcriptional regulator